MADTRTPASRRAASSASASRLPSARERRPALAALAVLLIVGGAFASGFLALQAGNRADFLRVKADVPQGAEITEADLESVSLPEDLEGVISADDQDDVVGTYAVAPLLPGTILTEDMVDDDSAVPEGKERVTFDLDSGVPPDLEQGASITVYAVSEEGDTDPYEATLVSVEGAEGDGDVGGGSSTILVTVLMDVADAAAVQPARQDDRISITETAPQQDSDDSGDSESNGEGGE